MEMESLAGIVMGSPWSLAADCVRQSSSYFLGLVLGRCRGGECRPCLGVGPRRAAPPRVPGAGGVRGWRGSRPRPPPGGAPCPGAPPLTRAPVSPLSRQRGTLAAAAVVAALLCGGRAPQLSAAATWCLLRLAGVLDCVQGELRVLGNVTASQ